MKITGFNYLALGLKGNKQLGGEDSSSEKIDLNDGLSLKELKLIDVNKDGAITLDEFQKKYGNDNKVAQDKFNDYLTIINYKKDKQTQQYDNKTVESTYNKSGKLAGYTETKVNSETGAKTVTEYTVENGKATKRSSKVVNLDGSTETKSADGKTKTKTANGLSVSVTDGRITQVSNTDKKGNKEQISIAYNSKGQVKSAKVKIGNSTIEGDNVSYSKDGKTITIKDDHGNKIAKIKVSDDKTSVYGYSDGTKIRKYDINKANNSPLRLKKYDSEGNITRSKNAQTGNTKKYNYDENGKLDNVIKYNADGKKTCSYTYYKKDASEYYANKDGALVKGKTTYDEDGNVLGYKKYSYKTNDENGTVTKKVRIYPELSSALLTQDSYGNTLFKYTKTKDGKKEGIEYSYDTKLDKKVRVPLHYKEVTTNSENKNIVDTYENGAVSHREVTVFENGEGYTTKYDYEYYPNSNNTVKAMKLTDNNGNVYNYKYDIDGSYTKEYKDEYNNNIVEQCNKDGFVTHKEVTDASDQTSKYDYIYDENNNVKTMKETTPDDIVITYQYEENGSYTRDYTDKDENYIVENCYANGYVFHKEVTDKNNSTTLYDYEYDDNYNVIKRSETYPDNTVTIYEYNDDDSVTKKDIDENGLLKYEEITDKEGSITKYDYEYDEDNNLIKKTEKDKYDNIIATYEYIHEDAIVKKSYKDENGNDIIEYYYENDLFHQYREEITDENNNTTIFEYEYDDNYNITKKTEKDKDDNIVATYEYDIENGTHTKTYNDDSDNKVVESYDANGNITNKKINDGENTIEYTYEHEFDDDNNIVKTTELDSEGNPVTVYEYNIEDGTFTKKYEDSEGNKIVESFRNNAVYRKEETNSADETTITEFERDDNNNITKETITYHEGNKTIKHYDENNHITQKEEIDTDGNNVIEYYDENDVITLKREFDENGNLKYTYEYEPNGYYTKKYKDEEGNEVVEKYDNHDQLIG